MESPLPKPRRIAIGVHPSDAAAAAEAQQIAAFLRQHGAEEVLWAPLTDETLRRQVSAAEFDLLIAAGGDGSMLRAGHLCAAAGIPLLGINLGTFGFLMELQTGQWQAALQRLLAGNYWLENRMMLHVSHYRAEQLLDSWSALNEVVVCRGPLVRPVELTASVDGCHLATYIADGLIVATATGSTAYALAVGGPILPPEARNILIVAVAPHLSVDRAVVLSEGAVIRVQVHTRHEAALSVDGSSSVPMLDGDTVQVEANHDTVQFIRFQDRGYFYRTLNRYMEQNPAAGKHR